MLPDAGKDGHDEDGDDDGHDGNDHHLNSFRNQSMENTGVDHLLPGCRVLRPRDLAGSSQMGDKPLPTRAAKTGGEEQGDWNQSALVCIAQVYSLWFWNSR